MMRRYFISQALPLAVCGAVVFISAVPLFASELVRDAVPGITRETVHVEYVFDGDTFRDAQGNKYRLVGINAPEVDHPDQGKTGEPGGEESARRLSELILNRDVNVVYSGRDPYGRCVALVSLPGEEESVNEQLVREGHARVEYLALAPPWFDAQAFSDAMSSPSIGVEQLSPNDKIYVAIGNQSQTYTIAQGGSIYLKGLGEIRVAGRNHSDVKREIRDALAAKGIPQTLVDIVLISHAEIIPEIPIFGAVSRQGKYKARTLIELLAAAGGIASNGPASEGSPGVAAAFITVRDTAGVLAAVAVADLFSGAEPDITLAAGDVVSVSVAVEGEPKAVSVHGEVIRPGPVRAATVLEAVGIAFGPKPGAATERVQVRHRTGATDLFDYAGSARGEASDLALEDGDFIFVPAKLTVRVTGAVANPGWIYADSLREAIASAGWFTPEAAPESGEIRNRSGIEFVDLAILIDDPDADLAIASGDEIIVPARPAPFEQLPDISGSLHLDSNVLVTGFGVKTTVVPPGDLRDALVSSGYAPGRSNITMRVYRRLPEGRKRTILLDLDKIIHATERFETKPGDSVYVEEKSDPITFLMRLIGFERAVASTVNSFAP